MFPLATEASSALNIFSANVSMMLRRLAPMTFISMLPASSPSTYFQDKVRSELSQTHKQHTVLDLQLCHSLR